MKRAKKMINETAEWFAWVGFVVGCLIVLASRECFYDLGLEDNFVKMPVSHFIFRCTGQWINCNKEKDNDDGNS